MPRKRELEEGWTSLATACAIIEAPLQKMGEETGDGERERREVSQTRGTHVGPTLTYMLRQTKLGSKPSKDPE